MSENELYKQMYYKLFNAVTDAIEAIDRGWITSARNILIKTQQDCEEAYISLPPPGEGAECNEASEGKIIPLISQLR